MQAVVGAVPEHGRGRSDPRAQKWSGQYPSTVVVCAVPEHISGLGSIHDHLRCLYYYFVYFSLFSAKASLTRLVKKVNRYSTSICHLPFFFCFYFANSRLTPVLRCVSVGPLAPSTKRRVHC